MKKFNLLTVIIILACANLTIAQNYTQQVTAFQYYFNFDPGPGISGNGGIIPVTPASNINQTLSIPLPQTLANGVNHLYIRAKDEFGQWGIAERRSFFVLQISSSEMVSALEYFIDTDPGVENGTVQVIGPSSSYSGNLAITIPNTLSSGVHHLYIRARDENGSWGIAERRSFFILQNPSSEFVTALEYFIDTDPGVGNGTVQVIGPSSSYSGSLAITIPNTLSSGVHHLYIRIRDENGNWGIAERRSFFVIQSSSSELVSALEYYYDIDPGVGNANPIAISPSPSINGLYDIGVPCLSTGTHYLYVRARDEYGRWSIIERDTLQVTDGISPSIISPAGPVTICPLTTVTLSVVPAPGISYQWQKDTVDITGATSSSLIIQEAGNYQVKAYCRSDFSISDVVTAYVLPVVTFYADADNDGFGNPALTILDCTPPTGYVANSDDCDDTDANINPAATEICGNNIDDNCNGLTDEGCCTLSVEAGPDTTSSFGLMSAQTITRSAVVTGGTAPFTFSWTLGRPLICNYENEDGDEEFYGGTCQDNVCPANGSPTDTATCEGDATITATLLDTALICVTVTDSNGCTATDCFYINASDVRCFAGNSGSHKVLMCHHTNNPNNPWVEICVDTSAVAAHLAQGDYLGACDLTKEIGIEGEPHVHDISEDLYLTVYPNPTRNFVTVEFISWVEDKFTVEFADVTGRKLIIEQGNAGIGENTHILYLPGIEPGLYVVRIVLDGNQEVKKLIVE